MSDLIIKITSLPSVAQLLMLSSIRLAFLSRFYRAVVAMGTWLAEELISFAFKITQKVTSLLIWAICLSQGYHDGFYAKR